MNALVGVAVLPVAVLCYYINKKDVDKEPKKLLRRVFIFGMLSVVPIVFLELFAKEYFPTDDASDLIKLFASTFMGVALIEEIAKWAVVHFCVYRNKEFNHPYDAIVYAVYASLGFAVVENLLYVLTSGFYVGVVRAILTVPSHACDAIIMGYYMGKSKQAEYKGQEQPSKRYMALSLLMPITVHAIYDYLLFTQRSVFLIIFLLFVSLVYIICFRLVKEVSKNNFNFDGTTAIPQNNNVVVYDNVLMRKSIMNRGIIYSLSITTIITILLVVTALILSLVFLN